jgi:hypothetical protein
VQGVCAVAEGVLTGMQPVVGGFSAHGLLVESICGWRAFVVGERFSSRLKLGQMSPRVAKAAGRKRRGSAVEGPVPLGRRGQT